MKTNDNSARRAPREGFTGRHREHPFGDAANLLYPPSAGNATGTPMPSTSATVSAPLAQPENEGRAMETAVPQADKLAFSLEESARLLSIGVSLLKELCYSGQIRSVKAGKRRVIAREELERFLRES